MITAEQLKHLLPTELQGFAEDFQSAQTTRDRLSADFYPIRDKHDREMNRANARVYDTRKQIEDWGQRNRNLELVNWVFKTLEMIRVHGK